MPKMIKKWNYTGFGGLAVIAVLAACGGGGGGGSHGGTNHVSDRGGSPHGGARWVRNRTPRPASPTPTSRSPFRKLPVPSSSARTAQTVGAGTNSITFSLLQFNGASTSSPSQTFGLTATSPGCSTVGSNLVCTLSIAAPIGGDIFLAQTFTGQSGDGNALPAAGPSRLAALR